MSTEINRDQYLASVHQSIVSGALKSLPSISQAAWETVLSKMTPDQRALYAGVDVKKMNTIVGLARKTSEKSFVAFSKDPSSVVVKLSPREMELLSGGNFLKSLAIGILCAAASSAGTVMTFGLGAAGAVAGEIVAGSMLGEA